MHLQNQKQDHGNGQLQETAILRELVLFWNGQLRRMLQQTVLLQLLLQLLMLRLRPQHLIIMVAANARRNLMGVPAVKLLPMKVKTGIPGMEMLWCARSLMWTRILQKLCFTCPNKFSKWRLVTHQNPSLTIYGWKKQSVYIALSLSPLRVIMPNGIWPHVLLSHLVFHVHGEKMCIENLNNFAIFGNGTF